MTGGGGRRSDPFGDYSSRNMRQQAEELGIVMKEETEVEGPLPPWHHRTGVGEAEPEVENKAEREEEEERRRREAMAEAWRKSQVCLPWELRDSL